MLARAIPASVLLPIPGAPPSRTSEPGTRPPPSTRSSSAMPGAEPRGALGLDVAEGTGFGPLAGLRTPAAAARGRCAHLLERVPGTAARALAGPGERGVAALGASVLGDSPGHPPRLGMGPDASRVRIAVEGRATSCRSRPASRRADRRAAHRGQEGPRRDPPGAGRRAPRRGRSSRSRSVSVAAAALARSPGRWP